MIGRCGALPSANDPRTIRYRSVARAVEHPAYAAPAPARDWRIRRFSWRLFGNGEVGCCTVATIARILQLQAGIRGEVCEISDDDVLEAYAAISGWNGKIGDPSDVGAQPLKALTYARNVGIGGHRIGAFVRLERNDELEWKSALGSFCGIYNAAALPRRIVHQGSFWDLPPLAARTMLDVPASFGRHAYPTFGYWRGEEIAVPWDRDTIITDAWSDRFVEERWIIVDEAVLAGDRPAPSGLDVSALRCQLAALAA